MKAEQYNKKKTAIKDAIKQLEEKANDLKMQYIESNKPCEIDTKVEIVTQGNRKIKGVVKSFALFLDDVIVSSVKPLDGKPMIYISVPYKSITVLP